MANTKKTVSISEKMTVEAIQSQADWSTTDFSNQLLKIGKREVKDSGAMWRLTCGMILRSPTMFEHDSLDVFMQAFGNMLALQTEHKDVPIATKGKNKGEPAWRSWNVTKPRWQYANYIYNAVKEQGSVDLVFPKNKPLPSLADVRKMQKKKASEQPIDTVKRCIAQADQALAKCKPEDMGELNNIIASLSIKCATMLAESMENKGENKDA